MRRPSGVFGAWCMHVAHPCTCWTAGWVIHLTPCAVQASRRITSCILCAVGLPAARGMDLALKACLHCNARMMHRCDVSCKICNRIHHSEAAMLSCACSTPAASAASATAAAGAAQPAAAAAAAAGIPTAGMVSLESLISVIVLMRHVSFYPSVQAWHMQGISAD